MAQTTTAPATAAPTADADRAPRDRRRRWDRALLGLVVVVTVVLYAEMFLRLNGMLPEIPVIPLNLGEVLFAIGNAIGLGGTVLLALTAPKRSSEPAVATAADAAPATTDGASRSDRRRRPLRPVLTDG